jgi:excisionase family DNA binding protein
MSDNHAGSPLDQAHAWPVTAHTFAPDMQQWLTLKDASEFLGVHFTTLRAWADNGEIRVFRTPGGHRRFSLADLRRFLEERATQHSNISEDILVDAAVVLVRKELQNGDPPAQASWYYPLDEAAHNSRRSRGRQLFSLAISYVLKPAQRVRILDDGRKLGREYGHEAGASQLSLAATGRAVRFFRGQLIQAVRSQENPDLIDADDVRIQSLLDQFLDEVLYAVLDGYEQCVRQAAGEPVSDRRFGAMTITGNGEVDA